MNIRSKFILCIIFITITNLLYSYLNRPLKVGVYNNYPKVYQTDSGDIGGIFPEILEIIAEREGWEIDYVMGSWDEGLERLANSEIDIMVDVAFSEERQQIYAFTKESVFINWGSVYTLPGLQINTVPDLQGKTVAVMKNSILTTGREGIYSLAHRYAVDCSFIEVEDYYQVFELVQKETADAGIVNRLFGTAFAEQYGLNKSNFIFNPTQLRYALPKYSPLSTLLISDIDKNLIDLQNDMKSDYYKILTKYNIYPGEDVSNWLLPLLIIAGLLIVFFFIIYLTLKWQIRRKTRSLNILNDELRKEIIRHKLTYRELELSRENYLNFVENIPGLVFMYDQDETGNRVPVIATNRNEEFLGHKIAQDVKRDYNSFFNYIVPEDNLKLQEISKKIEETGENLDAEYRVQLDNDQVKWFRAIGKVYKLNATTTRWQGVILDIDERKQAEADLKKYQDQLENIVEIRTKDLQLKTEELEKAYLELKEADKLKSVFLASMSHELRTPLNSIIGFTGILLMGMVGDLSEEQKTQLKIVKESANHLLALINDILDISKIEAGKVELNKENFAVNEVIQGVVDSLQQKATEKGIYLKNDTSAEIEIFSDKRRVRQIIINLLGNAVKFTESGGVTISTETTQDNLLEIKVEDSGIGIKQEDMKRLFEPFQQIDSSLTKKYEGTGLGLHLTQKLLAVLNGEISVKSVSGKGTTFTVTLPVNNKDEK